MGCPYDWVTFAHGFMTALAPSLIALFFVFRG